MDNDLISREALKKHITEIFEREVKIDEKWARGLKYSLKIIDNAPTVEYPFYQEAYQTGYEEGQKDSERPQGKWITAYSEKKKKVNKCRVCGFISIQGKTNFCPNCGADMRKEGAE